MRTLRLWIALMAVAFLAACGADGTPEGKPTACTLDLDCDPGFYCGVGNKCVRDCAEDSECADGEICDPRGRCSLDGDCVEDNDCDSPPSAETCDGTVSVGFEAVGTCVTQNSAKVCVYDEVRTPCEGSCSEGTCSADACETVFCTQPPPSECSQDGLTRLVYGNGSCDMGLCDYQETTEACALGCTAGVCNLGTCENVDCNTPPTSECDGNTAITYAGTGTCDDSSGSAICNYAIAFDNCEYTRATCNAAVCENPAPQVGGVAIVEYMANPEDSLFDRNEWIEILNISGGDIDLTDWVIRSGTDNADETHPFADNPQTTVPAFADGARLLLARASDAAGGATVDYVYEGIALHNNIDFIEILNPAGDIVDRVYWESGAILRGRSRKFNPAFSASTSDNDDFTKWCPSMSDEYLTSNYGTPGAENTGCTVDSCQGFTCVKPDDFCVDLGEAVQFMAAGSMCEVSRFNNPHCDFAATNVDCNATQLCSVGICEDFPANPPAAGDVILTEFMGNPTKVLDSQGEWFELYNTTQADVPLFSLVFRDSDVGGAAAAWTISDVNAMIPAGGYVVFAKNTDSASNGGVTALGEFSGSFLNNSNIAADYTLSIERQDGVVVDSSYYGGVAGSSTLPVGASIQLSNSALDATSNDAAANWCAGTQTYGDGDSGTPGAANDDCL